MKMRLSKLLVPLAFSMLFSSGVAVATELTSAQYKAVIAVLTPLAQQGDSEAQYNLGVMYDEGLGVPENNMTAAIWYTLSAEQGDADAQYNLAHMFVNGEGVQQNNKTAYMWARLAAAQESADAQSLLGLLAGLEEDAIHSYMWLTLALYNGADYDTSMRESIKKLMTSTEVEMAQQMASRCLKSGYKDCYQQLD